MLFWCSCNTAVFSKVIDNFFHNYLVPRYNAYLSTRRTKNQILISRSSGTGAGLVAERSVPRSTKINRASEKLCRATAPCGSELLRSCQRGIFKNPGGAEMCNLLDSAMNMTRTYAHSQRIYDMMLLWCYAIRRLVRSATSNSPYLRGCAAP